MTLRLNTARPLREGLHAAMQALNSSNTHLKGHANMRQTHAAQAMLVLHMVSDQWREVQPPGYGIIGKQIPASVSAYTEYFHTSLTLIPKFSVSEGKHDVNCHVLAYPIRV